MAQSDFELTALPPPPGCWIIGWIMPPPLELQLFFFKEIVLPIVRETGKEIFLFIGRDRQRNSCTYCERNTLHTQCGHVHVSWHVYGGQKTTFRNRFSVVVLSPSPVGLGITQVFRFGNKCLYPLSHFTSFRNSTLIVKFAYKNSKTFDCIFKVTFINIRILFLIKIKHLVSRTKKLA